MVVICCYLPLPYLSFIPALSFLVPFHIHILQLLRVDYIQASLYILHFAACQIPSLPAESSARVLPFT